MSHEHLIPKLQARFPERSFKVVSSPTPSVVFPASHPDVGPVEITDDNGECTVCLPRFTHGHFSNCDENLSENQAADQVAEDVVAFLERLFADEIVLWGNGHGAGGWYARDKKQSLLSRWLKGKAYVWSGPLPSAG